MARDFLGLSLFNVGDAEALTSSELQVLSSLETTI